MNAGQQLNHSSYNQIQQINLSKTNRSQRDSYDANNPISNNSRQSLSGLMYKSACIMSSGRRSKRSVPRGLQESQLIPQSSQTKIIKNHSNNEDLTQVGISNDISNFLNNTKPQEPGNPLGSGDFGIRNRPRIRKDNTASSTQKYERQPIQMKQAWFGSPIHSDLKENCQVMSRINQQVRVGANSITASGPNSNVITAYANEMQNHGRQLATPDQQQYKSEWANNSCIVTTSLKTANTDLNNQAIQDMKEMVARLSDQKQAIRKSAAQRKKFNMSLGGGYFNQYKKEQKRLQEVNKASSTNEDPPFVPVGQPQTFSFRPQTSEYTPINQKSFAYGRLNKLGLTQRPNTQLQCKRDAAVFRSDRTVGDCIQRKSLDSRKNTTQIIENQTTEQTDRGGDQVCEMAADQRTQSHAPGQMNVRMSKTGKMLHQGFGQRFNTSAGFYRQKNKLANENYTFNGDMKIVGVQAAKMLPILNAIKLKDQLYKQDQVFQNDSLQHSDKNAACNELNVARTFQQAADTEASKMSVESKKKNDEVRYFKTDIMVNNDVIKYANQIDSKISEDDVINRKQIKSTVHDRRRSSAQFRKLSDSDH